MLSPFQKALKNYFNVKFYSTHHLEKIISIMGAFLAILILISVSRYFVKSNESPLIIFSSAASVILVFALPHSPFSQPWPVIGGHCIAAIIGITFYELMPYNIIISAPLAISLSLTAMYFFRCVHPPGGATAFTTVIGGNAIESLSYSYVITPVLLNMLIVVSIGIFINYFFPWRRYPIHLAEKEEKLRCSPISSEDLHFALQKIGNFSTVTEQEAEKIYTLAIQHNKNKCLKPFQIQLNHYYSNGKSGEYWSIRQIIEESNNDEQVIYKIIVGRRQYSLKTCTKEEFAQWAKYEVVRSGYRTWQHLKT